MCMTEVGHLRRPPAKVRAAGGVTQIDRQPVVQRGDPAAYARVAVVPPEQLSKLPAQLEERARNAGRDAVRPVPDVLPLLVQLAWDP